MKALRVPSNGNARNRPGGRLRHVRIIFNARGEIAAIKNPMPPSQGRGQNGHDDSTAGYKPIVNEPRINTDIIREALKARVGIVMPVPETRQAKHERAKQQCRLNYIDACEAFKLAADNRPARESHSHSTRASRRRKHEEQ